MKVEWVVAVILMAVHLGIIFGLNVPDCPKGYLGPGGKHMMASHPNCIGGAIGFIDRKTLGEMHIYQHPIAKYVYDSNPFDPEGIFGINGRVQNYLYFLEHITKTVDIVY